ncbi:antiviral RADAR system adenosine deaminase RdrB [uncultured Shewanella sp.]|uniref:antiviral RADAR system adenosine deaminase RdrB n=1 Tax=uncultured Shewanella sp. TaxID=173975 RepID=UPI002616A16F|nr:antiviral RADAR system adenosine deaminase RdrB [uncultured Shewanella sp.]
MLKVNDTTIAQTAYLASDRLLQLSLNQSHGIQDLAETKTKLHQAIMDYQPYTHRKLRSDDVEAMLHLYILDNSNKINKEHPVSTKVFLTQLANTYLTWNGQSFIVKPDMLQAWLALMSLQDPSWIIAQAYTDLLKDHQFSVQEIAHCIEQYQCPFALPTDSQYKMFADNHVHLGGHGHLGPSLLSFCLYGETIDETFDWPVRHEYTLFESGRLNKKRLSRWCGLLADDIAVQAFYAHDPRRAIIKAQYWDYNDDIRQFEDKTLNAISQLKSMQGHTNLTDSQFCLMQADCRALPSTKRWLLFTTGLLVNNQEDTEHSPTILQLIRSCNILRNYMIVSGVGLTQFVDFFQFKGRKYRSHQQLSAKKDSLSADMDSQILREFRVSPEVTIGNNHREINPKALTQSLKALFKQTMAENAHFVLHFSRSLNRKNQNDKGDKLQQAKRKKIKSQVTLLQDFSHSITFSEQEVTHDTVLTGKISPSMDLRKAVRGYDVAGNENDLPIEVFAPALRVLRASQSPSYGLTINRLPKPVITVHAGEDFSHLLSGLRAIDEAIFFCDYQAGDRIGHALALGVSPSSWAKRQQTAYVSVGEHLDNLTWCFQKALAVIQTVPTMTGVLHLLQEKIHYWSEFLYGKPKQPKLLYEAWKLRRNCPIALNLYEQDNQPAIHIDEFDPMYKNWVMDFTCPLSAHRQKEHIKLWHRYLFAHLTDKSFLANRDTLIKIDCLANNQSQIPHNETFGLKRGHYFDSISSAELALYEAVQDWSMEHYADKGIILEACPTSNIYIGRFERYHEHPIFRWDPPQSSWLTLGEKYNKFGIRKGPITVCINTDDAALMPTTIRNEHSILQQTAVEHFNVSAKTANDWIDNIRQKGIDIFKDNHLTWVNE